MTELRFRMVADVSFNLLPVVPVVPNFLAVGTNGQQPLKRFDAGKRLLQFPDALRQGALKFQDADAHLHPGAKFFTVKRFRDVVVSAGV